MKKRILAFILLAAMLCSAVLLTACESQPKTPEEAAVKEIEKILASESVSGSTSIVANSSLEGQGITLSDSFRFNVNGNNTENEFSLPQVAMRARR